MRLNEVHRPTTLAGIVGQPALSRVLNDLARNPHSTCILLEGQPGVGKTTAALALANELGCKDEMHGMFTVTASELLMENVRHIWKMLRYRSWAHSGMKCLLIEELEYVSKEMAVFLKRGLETDRPPSTIIIATSNGAGKLPAALRQRFDMVYLNAGPVFAHACQDRICEVWEKESGGRPVPPEWPAWGWRDNDGEREFSMRVALDDMWPRLLEIREAIAA